MLLSLSLSAQVVIEGYTFEENNSGYVRKVMIQVVDVKGDTIGVARSDREGKFKIEVESGKDYRMLISRKNFLSREQAVSTKGAEDGGKVFVKVPLERQPGYVFDVTIAEARLDPTQTVNAIDSARIEVYNNTLRKEELVLKNYPHPTFKFNFLQGNHYTIMIRRKGFFNKRIEAYVNVAGCILCFDGLGSVEPNVVDVLTKGNSLGTFLANVELEPLELNKTITLENIYYDFNESYIRDDAAIELDKLIGVLKDNPGVTVELGSHTDSRGRDEYNLNLSESRARAAVAYIIENGDVSSDNIFGKGYGETKLVNGCRNGVKCSEANHQLNRRTELKIVGISDVDPLENKSLKQIIEEDALLEEVLNQEQIKIPEDAPPVKEEEIKADNEDEGGSDGGN